MSIPLPTINLSGVVLGQTGMIDLSNVGISAGGVSANPTLNSSPATVVIMNESGVGLLMTFSQNGSGSHVPAGAWIPLVVPPGESKITWQAEYLIPNGQVSQLLATYYAPGEPIPPQTTLGNSPIAGNTSGQLVTAQILDNEQAAGTEFIIGKPLTDVLHAVSITTGAVFRFGDASFPGSGTFNGPITFNNTVSALDIVPTAVVLNGGTSGTATANMDLTGTIKRCLIFLSNFRTAAAAQTLALPTAFTSHAFVRTGVAGISTTPTGIQFLLAGNPQSMRIYATPSANGDSGAGPNTTIYGGSWAEINSGSGFDTVQFLANWGAAFTGLIEIVGL